MRLGISCLLLLLSFSTIAQFKNVQVGEAAVVNRGCGPSIVINKKNPNNIVAASTLDDIY
jgi:hypothetical protein